MRVGDSIFFVLGGMAVLAFLTVFIFMPESLAPPPPGVKVRKRSDAPSSVAPWRSR